MARNDATSNDSKATCGDNEAQAGDPECGYPGTSKMVDDNEARRVDWSRSALVFGWCDVFDWSALRGTCAGGAGVRWPRLVGDVRLHRQCGFRSCAANAQRSSSRRRALLIALALVEANRLACVEELLPVLLPLLEASALFLTEEDDILEICVEVLRRLVGQNEVGEDETDLRVEQSLVDAGFLYRAASVLDMTSCEQTRRGLLECLRIVLLRSSIVRTSTSRLADAMLRSKSLESALALEAMLRNARELDSTRCQLPEKTFEVLSSESSLAALAGLARRSPGSRQTQSVLYILNCLCDFGCPRLVRNGNSVDKYLPYRVDVVTVVVNNLYADASSAFPDEWPTCAALALEILCKLNHLGLDEFGVYDDPDVALLLAPAAKVLVCHVSPDDIPDRVNYLMRTTPLYACNTLRFLSSNGYARAIIEADPNCEIKLEEVATEALQLSRSPSLEDHLQTRLRTLAYRAQALLQSISP